MKRPGLVVAGVLALAAVAAAAYFVARGPAAPAPGNEMAAAGQMPLETPPPAAAAPPTGTPEPSLAAPPAATVPAATAPPSAPPPQAIAAAPAASKKAPPKPAAGPKAVAAVPGQPTAIPPPEAAVPAATPPAPPAAPRAEKLPDTTYRKVKLVTQSGSSEKSTDVVLLFSDDRLSVTPAGGGAALRTLGYAEITAASYSKAQKKRLGFIKSAQHLLEIETGGEPLLLRLDGDNFGQILSALEARSGKVVAR